ncbi:hypothetical protein SBA3_1220002 [Candidatus Sulfopaludibacter sp. SbA3]|nr:hypothetical protein SBA3_1220002 [Candidatus Sulfopaludibacter sp. SbA3]
MLECVCRPDGAADRAVACEGSYENRRGGGKVQLSGLACATVRGYPKLIFEPDIITNSCAFLFQYCYSCYTPRRMRKIARRRDR